MSDMPGVVLVHGGFVDGSGWQGVYDLLTADGFRVSVVQNPTLSLEADATATRMILDRQRRRSSWDTPTAGQSSARSGRTSVSLRSSTSAPLVRTQANR